MTRSKDLITLIEKLLNPDDWYNASHSSSWSDKNPKYKNDREWTDNTHKVLSDEGHTQLDPKDTKSKKAKGLLNYASNGYGMVMNHIMRHGEKLHVPEEEFTHLTDDKYKEHINNLKSLTSNKTKHSFYSYRGVGENSDISDAKEGDIIHDKGFTSTSLSPKHATMFGYEAPDKKNLFKIHVKPGTKGFYASSHNKLSKHVSLDEREFILHPGTKFKVGKTQNLRGKSFTNLHIHSQED